ncbi:MAG: C_GCAxxG_C_C family protein, partial [Candidatus Krumholzibacteriota bacterium]|nr:C_GCAxxG_C_C family protein [Candidatus Krumholzibacteriota bacterium]
MRRIAAAARLFEEGFSCSQAVLAAFAPGLGLDRDAALRIAAPFGGGMGHQGETCGALAGAMMVIGLAHGRTRADDEAAKERAYALVAELRERFRAHGGHLLCRDLLGA